MVQTTPKISRHTHSDQSEGDKTLFLPALVSPDQGISVPKCFCVGCCTSVDSNKASQRETLSREGRLETNYTRPSVVRYPVFINCQADLMGSQLQLFLPNGSTPVFALLRAWTFLQVHCGVWVSFTSYAPPNTRPQLLSPVLHLHRRGFVGYAFLFLIMPTRFVHVIALVNI